MQKEIIETSKGKWLLVDGNILDKVSGQALVDEYGDYIILSKITEKEASEIVDCHKSLFGVPLETHIESLHSLLKSKGIKITNNTYIFKL